MSTVSCIQRHKGSIPSDLRGVDALSGGFGQNRYECRLALRFQDIGVQEHC